MPLPLHGRVAIVTGVSRRIGIGFAVAERLASLGAELFIHSFAAFDADQPWAKAREPGAVDFARHRIGALARALGDKPHLDGERFTAGDLMMATVLRIFTGKDIVTGDPRLKAYIERCTARPAFKRALDAQLADFREAA